MDAGQPIWADAIATFERKARRGEVRSPSEASRYDDHITRLMVAYGMLSANELAPRRRHAATNGGAR